MSSVVACAGTRSSKAVPAASHVQTFTTGMTVKGLEAFSLAWHSVDHACAVRVGVRQSATEAAALGVGQANGPRPFHCALTSTQTSPFWSRMAQMRVCGTEVDACGSVPAE